MKSIILLFTAVVTSINLFAQQKGEPFEGIETLKQDFMLQNLKC